MSSKTPIPAISEILQNKENAKKLKRSTEKLRRKKLENKYIAWSSDEEFEDRIYQKRTDYTYSRSTSYLKEANPDIFVGSPHLSREPLHQKRFYSNVGHTFLGFVNTLQKNLWFSSPDLNATIPLNLIHELSSTPKAARRSVSTTTSSYDTGLRQKLTYESGQGTIFTEDESDNYSNYNEQYYLSRNTATAVTSHSFSKKVFTKIVHFIQILVTVLSKIILVPAVTAKYCFQNLKPQVFSAKHFVTEAVSSCWRKIVETFTIRSYWHRIKSSLTTDWKTDNNSWISFASNSESNSALNTEQSKNYEVPEIIQESQIHQATSEVRNVAGTPRGRHARLVVPPKIHNTRSYARSLENKLTFRKVMKSVSTRFSNYKLPMLLFLFVFLAILVFYSSPEYSSEIMEKFKSSIDTVSRFLKSSISYLWAGLCEFLFNAWKNFTALSEFVFNLIGLKVSVLSIDFDAVFKSFVGFFDAVFKSFVGFFDAVFKSFVVFFDTVFNNVVEFFDAVFKSFVGFFDTVFTDFIGFVDPVFKSFIAFVDPVFKSFGEFLNPIFVIFGGYFESAKIYTVSLFDSFSTVSLPTASFGMPDFSWPFPEFGNFSFIFEGLSKAFNFMYSGIVSSLVSFWSTICFVFEFLTDAFWSNFAAFWSGVSSVFEFLKESFWSTFTVLLSALSSIWSGLLATSIVVLESVETFLMRLFNTVFELFSNFYENISDFFAYIYESILYFLNIFYDKLYQMFSYFGFGQNNAIYTSTFPYLSSTYNSSLKFFASTFTRALETVSFWMKFLLEIPIQILRFIADSMSYALSSFLEVSKFVVSNLNLGIKFLIEIPIKISRSIGDNMSYAFSSFLEMPKFVLSNLSLGIKFLLEIPIKISRFIGDNMSYALSSCLEWPKFVVSNLSLGIHELLSIPGYLIRVIFVGLGDFCWAVVSIFVNVFEMIWLFFALSANFVYSVVENIISIVSNFFVSLLTVLGASTFQGKENFLAFFSSRSSVPPNSFAIDEKTVLEILENSKTIDWFEQKFKERNWDILINIENLRSTLESKQHASAKEKQILINSIEKLSLDIENIKQRQRQTLRQFDDLNSELEFLRTNQESTAADSIYTGKFQSESSVWAQKLAGMQEEIKRLTILLNDCCQSVTSQLSDVRTNIQTLKSEFSDQSRTYDEKLAEVGNFSMKLKDDVRLVEEDLMKQFENVTNFYSNYFEGFRFENFYDSQFVSNGKCVDFAHGLNMSYIQNLIKGAIEKYDADKTGLFDYAMHDVGGTVVDIRCTEPYHEKGMFEEIITYLTGHPRENNPKVIITPGNNPGQCYAFKGAEGYFVIKLREPLKVTGVTMEHISKKLSPEKTIASAPKKFSVFGLNATKEVGSLLGEFIFLDNNETLQYFPIENSENFYNFVELKILSNHGNIKYTCLYRFRVHGKPISLN